MKKTTKKATISKRGINATVNAAIAKNPNASPREMDEILREVGKRYGMTLKEMLDWMGDRI